ncbi:MAG: glycosyltransferase [Gemmatimonadota bacterium]|jgi:glycosyltransferase involved in cell wall biosynthesis|nr:glycosyltransferase [Gemmatimonadota bacterium]MDP6529397.1 glycosyltransferase [Gemmatimonadota bacterium]MDP6803484.1 glycosyltransferase [Gemmatimonadota bacterium]MDP7031711.1 glycosyltransferase [Gemmatimonadota bacterium]
MNDRPAVSVVVPVYDNAATLARLLRACRQQDHPGGVEVIVVDDGSRDDSAGIAEEAGVRVIRQENRGPAAARNRGWREATADIILFTDADCVPRTDWARLLAEGVGGGFAAAGGTYGIVNPESALARSVHAEIVWRHSGFPEEIDFAGSFNLGVKRAAMEEVGGFDESFPLPSGEDNDLSYRLRDAGHRIRFVREAVVDHHHPDSLGRYLREQARHGEWRVVLYASHPRRARGDRYAGPADLAAPPVAALCAVFAFAAPFAHRASAVALLLLAVLALLQWRACAGASRREGSPGAGTLLALGIVRAFARAWGMTRGVVRVLFSRRNA